MADPTTELAREFLEFNHYLVRTETKFYRNKKLKGTPSDIDIIATRSKRTRIDELELKRNIIGEVKNWQIMKEGTVDRIYRNKFRHVDDPKISWQQLRNYIPSRIFDKVLFCLATTEDVYNHALVKYKIKIITTGFIIKQIANFFKESPRRWSYYPEWYNYNIIKSIMYYLFNSHMKRGRWKDKLTLEDLVWINPEEDPQYRNRFVEGNSKFLEDFIYYQTSGEVFSILIRRFAQGYQKWFKDELKSNKRFWTYLTKYM